MPVSLEVEVMVGAMLLAALVAVLPTMNDAGLVGVLLMGVVVVGEIVVAVVVTMVTSGGKLVPSAPIRFSLLKAPMPVDGACLVPRLLDGGGTGVEPGALAEADNNIMRF